MVRTRGLGRALGHVTGRGVGRGDHDDSDDASQCRRPTASARRQQVLVTAVHDEPVVPVPDVETDVFSNDPMAPSDVKDIGADIPADTGAQATEDEHEGFPGGPSDPSVLTQYAGHVACSVWTGEERPELKLSSHRRKIHSLGRHVPAIERLVAGTGLSPLITCSVDTSDRGLLSSFVERWHQETSSFHLPVGELTITLDDVSSLLHLSVRLPGLRKGSVVDRTYACNGYVISTSVDARQSATNVHVVYLEALRDLSQTGRYAWGVAALCWIYEHFPSVAESTADQDYNEDSPCAYRWIATKKTMKSIRTLAYRERLDQLRISDVCWIPYGEHRPVRDFHLISCYSGLLRWGPVAVYYRPERVVRQFGYTQTIPASSVDSWVSYDDIHDSWMHYSDHMVPAGEVCVVLGQCASDYMD
ncbi:protein MAIN-LIKE 1-like [Glycine soja]|uniref:protein MAIN-LIKE 1-like n=1 Tax=Glycine soja TaxID=3848 RepID=UPI00103E530C|nr:protein MAIN-LIKE 1-like [Glycine soja]